MAQNKNSKKGNVIYKVITAITLFVPLPVYLFLMATLFNIKPNYIIYTTIDNVEVIEYIENENTDKEEHLYFLTTKDNAAMDGVVEFRDGRYGIFIEEEDIIKIDKNYYSYALKDDTRQLIDIKKFEVQKQQSYKLPLTFFISLFGVAIAILIIQKKMQWYKKYKRLAAFLALLTVTLFLYIIDVIVSNILGVFVVATASWALYCLEYLFNKGIISDAQKEKQESDIIRTLREALLND